MGKMTLMIEDKVEVKLRLYVAITYPQNTYGKLGEITTKALRLYLDQLENSISVSD